jgi:hypothetical protein
MDGFMNGEEVRSTTSQGCLQRFDISPARIVGHLSWVKNSSRGI